MAEPTPLVHVVRSGVVESVHLGSVVVVDAEGRLVAAAGDPARVTFARSAMKPLQAAVSLSLAGDELPAAELAVMAASHNGEPAHLEQVGRLLERAGLGVEALRCPPALPLDLDAALAAGRRARGLHNCSGKHAGMLLACVRRGWDLGGYVERDHPLQLAVLDAVRRAAAAEPEIGVDGCGLPVHAIPLAALARLYAALATGHALGGLAGPVARVLAAMRAEPYLVAGRDRACTDVMAAVPEVVAKVGAEGVMAAAVVPRGLGVAVKVEDGGSRAAAPALLRALSDLGAVPDAAGAAIERWARPAVLGGSHAVGLLEPAFELRSR